jgi:hypothetical protein
MSRLIVPYSRNVRRNSSTTFICSSVAQGIARRPAMCAIVNSGSIVTSVRCFGRWNVFSVSERGAQVRPMDNPDELLCTAHRVIEGLLAMALSARYLSELQQVDQLLTHDVFDALCHRGIPMPRVSELVWPAVEALEHQASSLGMSWRPALCQGDWLMLSPREATGGASAASTTSGGVEAV